MVLKTMWTMPVRLASLEEPMEQVGDIFASSIKRKMKIKDYGKLIPGHGGVLDRFDSLLLVAPVIVMTLEIFQVI